MSCPVNNRSCEFRTFVIIIVIIYSAIFALTIFTISITVTITTIIIVVLVILMFIVIRIRRIINFIEVSFLSTLFMILTPSTNPGQTYFKVSGSLLNKIWREVVTIQRFNCSIKLPFLTLAILKCLKLTSLVTWNSQITFGIFAALILMLEHQKNLRCLEIIFPSWHYFGPIFSYLP